MISLRRRLFVILVLATSAIWLSASAWIYFRTTGEVAHVLDTRLQEAARMVHSLVSSDAISTSGDGSQPQLIPAQAIGYERQLSCQIWSIDGRLIGRSSGAPEHVLTEQSSGFSEHTVGGENWRVFAIEDPVKGIRVLVGDRLGLRHKLINDLIFALLSPAVLILPLLSVMIWISLGQGLRPLAALAAGLRARDASDMRAVSLEYTPREVAPLIDALNDLFVRLEQARNHERDITAFAAHELKTPLAGLKTQAQIAHMAVDAETKDRALQQILLSVDRTARLVRQLLALAHIESGYQAIDRESVDVQALLARVIADVRNASCTVSTNLDETLRDLKLFTDPMLLEISIRNLQENAVAFSPAGGTITWRAADDGTGLIVDDDGPGLPEAELARIPIRFYRGSNSRGSGSGLGLVIVDLAMRRLGGRLTIENRVSRGMSASLLLAPSAIEHTGGL